jgi:hypothetical protein
MITKYEVITGDVPCITEVQVEKETAHYIWMDEGECYSKDSETFHYFDTFKEAKDYVILVLKGDLVISRHRISKLKGNLKIIKRVKKAAKR